MLHNLPNLFVFADELVVVYLQILTIPGQKQKTLARLKNMRRKRPLLVSGSVLTHWLRLGKRVPTRSNQFLNSYKESRYAFSLRYKAFEPFEPSQVISWLSYKSVIPRKIDVTLFPETYNRFSSLIKEGGFYYLTGKIQERDGRLQMILAEATTSDQ